VQLDHLDQIAATWNQIDEALNASGGEITPEIAALIDAVNPAEAAKLDGYKFYIDAQEAEAEGHDAMRKHYLKLADEQAAKRDARLNRVKYLKNRLKDYMLQRGVKELHGEIFRFNLQVSGKRPVEVVAPVEALPPSWVKVERKPMLDVIRAQLEMPGNAETLSSLARLGEATTSIRIY